MVSGMTSDTYIPLPLREPPERPEPEPESDPKRGDPSPSGPTSAVTTAYSATADATEPLTSARFGHGTLLRDGGINLSVRHVLVIDREANDLRLGERLDEIDLGGRRRHRHLFVIAAMGPSRCVLQHDAVWVAAPENQTRSRVGWVTQCALSFDHDHVWVLALEPPRRRRLPSHPNRTATERSLGVEPLLGAPRSVGRRRGARRC